jgi:1-acyl-sn-glycerol-3-phosphate acyltransferase
MKKNNNTPFWKLIVGRIMAAWALILFIVTMLPAIIFYLPCFLLNDPAKASWHRHVSRVWMWIYLHLIGCPLKVTGKEHFATPTNYVIVCNHNSLMDVPVSTPFMPRPNKTIAKKSFAKIPFLDGSILLAAYW